MAYPKSPIREAVFDIRIDSLNISSPKDLKKIQQFVVNEFPTEEEIYKGNITLQQLESKEIEAKGTKEIVGYMYLSEDRTRQIQVRTDGFTLNILKPYETWEKHFETFITHWKNYQKLFSPNITRIATRFINKIEIPLNFDSFQDYVTNIPPIPDCLPQVIMNFFMQIQVPYHDDKKNIVITETVEPVENDILPFILDIDVFQAVGLDNSIESIEKNFNQIRDIKNMIFESCITDQTRTLLQ